MLLPAPRSKESHRLDLERNYLANIHGRLEVDLECRLDKVTC